MRILVSNDDGYFAPGIALLAERLSTLGEVTVVAPERDRSGASNSLTLDRHLTVRRAANGFRFVNGTPTDCVHLALTGLVDPLPDMVVSGITFRRQHGRRHHLFGHRRAAMEASCRHPVDGGLVASKAGKHFDTAAGRGLQMVERCTRFPITGRCCSTSTLPDLPLAALGGVERRGSGPAQGRAGGADADPRGENAYWIGAAGGEQDAGPGGLPCGRIGPRLRDGRCRSTSASTSSCRGPEVKK